jgi:hypothetical protein
MLKLRSLLTAAVKVSIKVVEIQIIYQKWQKKLYFMNASYKKLLNNPITLIYLYD